jgi:hypothetical protein
MWCSFGKRLAMQFGESFHFSSAGRLAGIALARKTLPEMTCDSLPR